MSLILLVNFRLVYFKGSNDLYNLELRWPVRAMLLLTFFKQGIATSKWRIASSKWIIATSK